MLQLLIATTFYTGVLLSDESTITASTLLSSLLGPASTNPTELTTQQLEGDALTGVANESPSFRQLMQFNIDGDDASFAEYDGGSPGTGNHNADWPLGDTAVNPTGIYPAQVLPASDGKAIELQESGNILPVTGNSLPPNTLESNTEVLIGDPSFFAQSDTDHTLRSADDSISATIDSIANLNESIEVATAPVSENQLPISQPLQQTPIGPTSLEQTNLRSRELSEASPGSATAADALDVNSETSMEGNPDFGQGDGTSDQSAENLFDARSQRNVTAEFALDDSRTNSQNSSAFPRTGEAGPGILPALGQATGTSPLVASSSLTVAGDRQLAGQQIAQHVASFVRQGDEFAEINLTPPHLGKITARITLENDQATVVLSAPSPEIRDIMEASLPKLSSLLEEAGLTLADANVEGQEPNDNNEETAQGSTGGDTPEIASEAPTTPLRETARGLLDAYA